MKQRSLEGWVEALAHGLPGGCCKVADGKEIREPNNAEGEALWIRKIGLSGIIVPPNITRYSPR